MPELSVILCTHNPRADYLRRTLAALAAQTLPKEHWEFLLIDNASKENLMETHNCNWHPHGRCVREEKLGITFARQRGIGESRGEWLVFVDDDNVLAPDFLEQVLAVVARHPHLAVFGAGILAPEFETPPSPEIAKLSFLLALRQVPAARWSNNPKDADCLPFGAGMCARRDIAERFGQFVAQLKTSMVIGRKGTQLFSGEDDLFSWVAAESGQGFGIFPELRITHLISAGRLSQSYFLRLIYYSTFSRGILHYLLLGIAPEKNDFFRLIRTVLHGIRNGRFSMRCQWAMAQGENAAARFISENRLLPVDKKSSMQRSKE